MGSGQPQDLQSAIQIFTKLGLALIPLLGAVALLVFAYGVARFIRSTGDESEMKKSKALLIWGVVGMFVLFTVWGIISFFRSQLGFGNSIGIPQLPLVPLVNSNVLP